MKSRILILCSQSGDWEQLWVGNSLISEGHVLGEGDNRLYLWRAGLKYGFGPDDIEWKELDDEDEKIAEETGSFPDNNLKYYK